jgi:hypothetical protein
MYGGDSLCCKVAQQLVRGKPSMPATIVERQEGSVTIQIRIPLTRSMLDTEEAIQGALNLAGVLAMPSNM